MLSSRDVYIKSELDATLRAWLPKAALFGVAIILSFGIMDSLRSPEGFDISYLYRVLASAFLLAGYWMVRRKLFMEYAAHLAVLWVTIIILFLEFTVFVRTGSETRFVIGNIVAAVVVIGFIPARFPFVLAMAGIVLVAPLLPVSWGLIEVRQFEPGLTFFYYVVILAGLLLMRFFTEQSVIHEIGMKFDLDQYRNGLEEEVAARTRELARSVESLQHEVGERQRVEEEHQNLQEQLLQAQKMESVGRLAGGLAHDVNNILTTIISACSLARNQIPRDHKALKYLKMIDSAGDRAAGIMGQLLAFSRKQVLSLAVVDLNGVIADVVSMLERVIGEDVRIEFRPGTGIGKIRADVTQLGQVLMNLALNSRDAMPNGGTINIHTADARGSEIRGGDPNHAPDERLVRLSVIDNGEGMTEEVKERIFEPFFTTKGMGRGTGLGLAVVYGIVTQHNWSIVVDSLPGKGAAFHIYMPATGDVLPRDEGTNECSLPGGTERILLVEDDESILALATEILSSLGYSVLPASSGECALETYRSEAHPCDLLVTDVVMPGMNGRMLAETLVKEQPTLRVLYISGYTDDKLTDRGINAPSVRLLQKPLRPESLAIAVRTTLDA